MVGHGRPYEVDRELLGAELRRSAQRGSSSAAVEEISTRATLLWEQSRDYKEAATLSGYAHLLRKFQVIRQKTSRCQLTLCSTNSLEM